MNKEFGELLRHYRKAADLTQSGLANHLIEAGFDEARYNSSRISKWENGYHVPSEAVVEELEEILPVPKGLLLKKAGYRTAADYRRLVAGESDLGLQQMEHIGELQKLARSVIARLDELSDKLELQELDSNLLKLWGIFKMLTGDYRWPMLSAHLGPKAREFEEMEAALQPEWLYPPWERGGSAEPYLKLAGKALLLLNDHKLWLIANSADTKEWEEYDLKRSCPWCPVEE